MARSITRISIGAGLLLICLVLLFFAQGASAQPTEIGTTGGQVVVESDIWILMDNGGGHIKWRISGNAAIEFRQAIDENFGPENERGDGKISRQQAEDYAQKLDNDVLTGNHLKFHGADLQAFSLLNRDRGIEENSAHLVNTDVDDTATIEIRFLIEATLLTADRDYHLSDTALVDGLFEALSGSNYTKTYTYVGRVEIKHYNIFVGICSFSNFDVDHGSIFRLRLVAGEYYYYSTSYKGDEGPKEDKARFDKFNLLQSPIELFVLLLIFLYLVLSVPRWLSRKHRKRKLKWLHSLALGLGVLLLLFYLFGLDGLFLFIFGPVFIVLIYGLSYNIYAKNWKNLAKPLSRDEIDELDRDDGIIKPKSHERLRGERGRRREYSESTLRKRHYADEYPEDEYDDYPEDYDEGYPEEYEDDYPEEEPDYVEERPAPPPRRERRPAPRTRPAPGPPAEEVHDMEDLPPPVEVRKIRCSKCREIFTTEIREKPTIIECSHCGHKGLIR